MKITGAVIKEQGQTFAVVLVKENVFTQTNDQKNEVAASFIRYFPGVPIVLMGDKTHQTWGRRDIVRFLENVHYSRLPWKEYTFS